jgi:hypothetical protein
MNTSAKDNKKTPAWLLERLAQGELDSAETEQLRARLAAEGRSLDDELAALERSNREILTARPKDVVAASIRRRAEDAVARKPRAAQLNAWIAPLALAGSLGIGVLAVRPWSHGDGAGPAPAQPAVAPAGDSPTERDKGKGKPVPQLLVYRQIGARNSQGTPSEQLGDGARASRGDLVQLAYMTVRDGAYGVLLSIDGAGRVTQHLPDEGAASAASLVTVGEVPLPSAYELDDAPGFERFVLVTAAEPFAVAPVREAARALAAQGARARNLPLALGPTFHQTSVLLQKTSKGTP